MIVTLSRQLHADELKVLPLLSHRLGIPVVDRRDAEAAAASLDLQQDIQGAEEESLPEQGIVRAWLHGPKRYGEAIRRVVEAMAARGSSFILVGCGGMEILRGHPDAFHLRLVARREDRLRRAEDLHLPRDLAEKTLRESDERRADFHRQVFHLRWEDPHHYHLTANTSLLTPEQTVELILRCLEALGLGESEGRAEAGGGREPSSVPWQHVTISREFGTLGQELGTQLSRLLGWQCWDDELMHRCASLEGIPVPELIRIDERGPGFLERLGRLQESARYFEGLKQAVEEAMASPSVIVGRGGNLLVPADQAFHLRLVADFADRLTHVMRHHWLSEQAARERIHEQDALRASFHRHFFRVDWSDPLLYHAVLNLSRFTGDQVATLLAAFLADARAG